MSTFSLVRRCFVFVVCEGSAGGWDTSKSNKICTQITQHLISAHCFRTSDFWTINVMMSISMLLSFEL
jgi:hypothetical protein